MRKFREVGSGWSETILVGIPVICNGMATVLVCIWFMVVNNHSMPLNTIQMASAMIFLRIVPLEADISNPLYKPTQNFLFYLNRRIKIVESIRLNVASFKKSKMWKSVRQSYLPFSLDKAMVLSIEIADFSTLIRFLSIISKMMVLSSISNIFP